MPKETVIPAPWGKITAKIWNDLKLPTVLLFHGIQDNASSFDRLIPLLTSNNCYICIDLPGHGKSDHFPQGLPIHTIDYVLVYRLVCDHFKKREYIIIGHSYGAAVATIFGLVYKEFVRKMVLLDALVRPSVAPENFPEFIRKSHEEFSRIQMNAIKNQNANVTRENAMEIMRTVRKYGNLTQSAAEVLLKRGTSETTGGRLKFNRDLRLRCIQEMEVTQEYLAEVFKSNRPNFPILLLKSKDFVVENSDKLSEQLKEIGVDVFEEEVDGFHHVHLEEPEKVASVICEFISK